jgi:hypothetical protein
MIVYYHTRTSREGWQFAYSHEYDSNKWTDWELDWIDAMLKHGQMCLTIGDSMFSLKKG